MASPIKRLASPQILTPLLKSSPALRVHHPYKHLIRNNKILKPLNFENVTIPNQVVLQVTNDQNNSILINSPNKNHLLKNGLGSQHGIEILGQGSFGTVVKGIFQGTNVSIKVVKLRTSCTLREKNALALSHENIVKVLDVVLNCNDKYGIVVMEYIQSASHLQSILDNHKFILKTDTIITFATQICKGLQYIHSYNVLHLDIKPNNILVCNNLICKLCDFGNSVKIEDVKKDYIHQGNVAYTAPEILRGSLPTTKCDVYSLGILLWQMKHRIMPYQNLDNAEEIIYKVVKYNLRPNDDVDLNKVLMSDNYELIYQKCWSAIPEKRPEVSRVMEELQNVQ